MSSCLLDEISIFSLSTFHCDMPSSIRYMRLTFMMMTAQYCKLVICNVVMLMISLPTNTSAAMPIVTQNNRMPSTTESTSPSEYLNEMVRTRMLQMMTHCANIHIPDDTMSNMYPWLFTVSSIDMNVSVERKKLKITGNTNHSDTRLRLKSLLSNPSRYSLGFLRDYLRVNLSS